MHDIFISYARSRETEARRIADALRSLGYGVWRDDELPAHRSYADVIEERLRDAKAVVVVWSADAVKSEWVQSEADRARSAHKLVQMKIDDAALPMPFDRIQCADLSGWAGDAEAAGWRKVVDSIAELVGMSDASAPSRTSPAAAAEPLLAVLAFDNLSGDPEMAYFSDGVSEEIQQTVARGTDLKVIGRTSSFQLRGADKTVRKVAAELKATHILDGSVRRAGARVRISAQLIACAGEVSLWSERFDRDLTDIFALQDEIAAAVAAALKTAFAPAAEPQSIDPAAFDLYLQARTKVMNTEVAARSEADDPDEAAALFERAVALAPKFAAAWAGLANARAHQILYGLRDRPFAQMRAGVVEAVETALRLDPASGLAYAALSVLEPYGRHLERETLLEKALSLAPDDPELLYKTHQHYFYVGRVREALAFCERARELDPLYPPAAYTCAVLMEVDDPGRYDESQALFAASRAKWTGYPAMHSVSMNQASWRGDWELFETVAAGATAPGSGVDPQELAWLTKLGRALREPDPEVSGRVGSAFRKQLARTGWLRLDTLITASSLGMKEEAFAAIDEASFAPLFEPDAPQPAGGWSSGIIFMWDSNREVMDDIRFVGLCAKLGLVDYWVKTGHWPDCAEKVPYDFKAEARRLASAPAVAPIAG